jgi:hypothetical protein
MTHSEANGIIFVPICVPPYLVVNEEVCVEFHSAYSPSIGLQIQILRCFRHKTA